MKQFATLDGKTVTVEVVYGFEYRKSSPVIRHTHLNTENRD
jgi:hypothetical protein